MAVLRTSYCAGALAVPGAGVVVPGIVPAGALAVPGVVVVVPMPELVVSVPVVLLVLPVVLLVLPVVLAASRPSVLAVVVLLPLCAVSSRRSQPASRLAPTRAATPMRVSVACMIARS
jgi:hypothetical protein